MSRYKGECEQCCFCWVEPNGFDDGYPRCHWESRCPDDHPPCEDDDYYYDEPADDPEWV